MTEPTHQELQAQVDELKESLAEGNARFHETVAAVVAQLTETLRTQLAERDADLERNERSYQAVVQRADRLAAERLAAERNAMREVVEAVRKDVGLLDIGCDCLTHRALARLDKAQDAPQTHASGATASGTREDVG